MEHKSCPVFVDGKECDRPLTLVLNDHFKTGH